MRAFGWFFRRTGRWGALRVKSGDAFTACGEKYGITAREAEIIHLLLEGKGAKEITEALFISDHTVKNHIHNIYRKLGIRNRIQLVQCFRDALDRTADGEAPLASVATAPAAPRTLLRRAVLPGMLALVVAAASLIAWKPWDRRPRTALRPPLPALAVLDFENLSDDPDLGKWVTGFPTLLTTDLLQSKSIRTVGDDRVYGALKKYGLTGSGRFSREELRRLARELKADYLVSGSLLKAGASIIVTAFLHDVRTGATIRTEKIECPDEQALLREVDPLARLVRVAIDPKPAVAGEDVDLDVEELTTSYALAYRYYAEAQRYHRTGDYEQSLIMLRKAVELDPEFAMAYRLMSVDARNLGYFTQEVDYMRTAFELSARLPEDSRERHLIRGDYYSLSESTYGLAVEAFKLVLRDHPEDLIANNNLAMLYYDLEEYEAAVRHADVPIRQNTDHPFPYHTKASALKALGRSDEAARLLESYLENHPANRLILWTLAAVLIDAHDYVAALAALDRAAAVFPDPSWAEQRGTALFHLRGAAAAQDEVRRLLLMEEAPWRLKAYERLGSIDLSAGRFTAAAQEFGRGVDLAETTGQHDWAMNLLRLRGQALLGAGDTAGALAEARRSVEAARAAGGGYKLATALLFLAQVQIQAADVAGAAGLSEQFRGLTVATGTRRLLRTQDFYLGCLELARGRPSEAARLIEKALAQFPRRDGSDSCRVLFDFYLAAARERAGDVQGAAQTLRRILASPGDTLDFEGYFAKAALGLARLEDRLGRREAALAGYRTFLTMWKDADPGRPEITEARERLAALSSS
jgi:tetratricopeptide (TPR) repeat protein/DNA-binding CsgD family transcriptional regulator/TolB-like protein